MEDKSIAEIKVVEKDMCLKCDEQLKTISLGGDSLFGMGGGKGAFYCENKQCDFFGLLTVGRRVQTDKRVELTKEKKD